MKCSTNTKGNSTGEGIGFFGLLTILFIGLKLANYISWSWWWVFSPLWISGGVAIVALVIFAAFYFIFKK